ncbi:PLP-dependent aminotransferase family protein [Paenibacillus glycanilyticus]|uniref:GntR family transcriptional regulator n=1 Tax=Paenibacillus glycanilyticus TaxID=126569 RepID=A0ABQ6G7V0_9BACL|nr:PLP-dependent aminotransferase family protein [Paenibacillus glycanilyticus]GLX67051.1 GntR family transcriptional regulator [Paenibacillus glycanilyticus]
MVAIISLTPELDKQSEIPLYQQLFHYLKGQIESGLLKENERLPSIRQMSAYLSVSKNTVETAYQQLLAEGYVHSRLRSGLYVMALEKLEGAVEQKRVKTGPIMDPAAKLPHAINFEYGDVELEHFPVRLWKKCLVDALEECTVEVYGYGDRQGHAGLRGEIAKYLYQARGVVCSQEQIFLSAGTQTTISLLAQLLPLPRDIAMEEPGYHGVRTVLLNMGRNMIPIPLDSDGISTEYLKQCEAKTVYVTPSHQFPLGMIMPVQNRIKLLQWAYEQDGYIIEDDFDSELRYQGQPIPALKALDTGDKVIYLGTFSKSFLPGIRLSYMVLPERVTQEYRNKLEAYSQSVSPLIQAAMYRFMKEGYFESHIRKMRKLYQSRHKLLLRTIQEQLGSQVEVIGERSGMHLLLDVHGRSSDELVMKALEHEVIVYTPRKHWLDAEACPPSYIMLGFGGLSEELIREGIGRLKQAWFG